MRSRPTATEAMFVQLIWNALEAARCVRSMLKVEGLMRGVDCSEGGPEHPVDEGKA